MKKSVLNGTLALAALGGVVAVSGAPLLAGAGAPLKASAPAVGQRVATLSVVNVGCATCAPVVTKALKSVPGVVDVSVSEGLGASATARVIYDPRKVTPSVLATATTDAGYPANVVSN